MAIEERSAVGESCGGVLRGKGRPYTFRPLRIID
jgi:hypothetical protein